MDDETLMNYVREMTAEAVREQYADARPRQARRHERRAALHGPDHDPADRRAV